MLVTDRTYTILILCAGESKRWSTSVGVSKHMLDILGSPLLIRMIQQVNLYQQVPCVVTHDTHLIESLGGYSDLIQYSSFHPPYREYTCQTLQSTVPGWSTDKVIVLLGDVVYSHSLLDTIMIDMISDIMFYGSINRRELYALTFSLTSKNVMCRGLDEVSRRVNDMKLHGQLWQLFYVLHSFDGGFHPPYVPSKMFYPVTDFTQDFDKEYDYKKFLLKKIEDDVVRV